MVKIKVDAGKSSYFEWLGAGLYSPSGEAARCMGEFSICANWQYGFEEDRFKFAQSVSRRWTDPIANRIDLLQSHTAIRADGKLAHASRRFGRSGE